MTVEKVLAALKARQIEMAQEAMARPANRGDGYELGHLKGWYNGLRDAIDTVERLLSQEAEDFENVGGRDFNSTSQKNAGRRVS